MLIEIISMKSKIKLYDCVLHHALSDAIDLTLNSKDLFQ